MDILSEIAKNVEQGDSAAVKTLLRKALSMNIAPERILNSGLIKGMEAVGKKFKANEIFIPEVLIASRAMKSANLNKNIKKIIGGAPVTQSFADEIGADGYAPDGISAVTLIKTLLNNKESGGIAR